MLKSGKKPIRSGSKLCGPASGADFKPSSARGLKREFFDRDPRAVARRLLGKVLLRRLGSKLAAGRIVEVEAYLGADDAAAHAAAGETARNRVLFGPPAHAYVYFIYGNHYCLNVSCLPAGKAGCVLIRALEPLAGLNTMAAARGLPPAAAETVRARRALTSGPGRLCQALGITRLRDNGKDLLARTSDLHIVDDGYRPARILASARIGISKAPELPLRYLIAGNEFVSRKLRSARK